MTYNVLMWTLTPTHSLTHVYRDIQRDRQTDRQTDRRTDGWYTADVRHGHCKLQVLGMLRIVIPILDPRDARHGLISNS